MTTTMEVQGVLPIWKPAGMTSHDVVARIRRLLGIKRVGHTGTLDPAVTGVLPICVGRATRLVEYIQEMPKSYEAIIRFGQSTDTQDVTGELLQDEPGARLSELQIRQALSSFHGPIEQLPPMYSAVKVNGQRLYDLARQGLEIERKARTVTIYSIRLLDSNLEQDYPECRFEVDCSKGTYIRTLCVDIGTRLHVPAVMKQLVRTATGPYTEVNCITLSDAEQLASENRLASRLLPADEALAHMPALTVSPQEATGALQGKPIPAAGKELSLSDNSICRLYGPDRTFLGLFLYSSRDKLLRPEKVFS